MKKILLFLVFLILISTIPVFSQSVDFWSVSGVIGKEGRTVSPDAVPVIGLGKEIGNPTVIYTGAGPYIYVPDWPEVSAATAYLKVSGPGANHAVYCDWPEYFMQDPNSEKPKNLLKNCWGIELYSEAKNCWKDKGIAKDFSDNVMSQVFSGVRPLNFLIYVDKTEHRNLAGFFHFWPSRDGWYRMESLNFVKESSSSEFGPFASALRDARQMWPKISEEDASRYAKALIWQTRYVPQGFSAWPEDPQVLCKYLSEKYKPEPPPPAKVKVAPAISERPAVWAFEFVGFGDEELKLWLAPVSVPPTQLDQLARENRIPCRAVIDQLQNGNRAIAFDHPPVAGVYWYRVGMLGDWRVLEIDPRFNAVINRQ